MATPNKSSLNVISKSHWHSNHQTAGFVLQFKVIDNDIIHIGIESERDVILDFMDSELLQVVISESGLVNKPFYFVLDLNHISNATSDYKAELTNLIFNSAQLNLFQANGKSALRIIGLYNIPHSMQFMAESVAAIIPERYPVVLAETYEEMIEKVMAFKAGEFPGKGALVEDVEEAAVKKRFLEAVARISWFNMLEQDIPMPATESRFYPFFRAIDAMRSDLMIKTTEKEREIKLLKHDFDIRINQMMIKMNVQAEMNTKAVRVFEKEIAALKSKITTQDMQLTNVHMTLAEKTIAGCNFLDMIDALEIDDSIKALITDNYKSLIEKEGVGIRLNIEPTDFDLALLNKVNKKHPNLTQRELRIILLVIMNYETSEIASSIGTSTRGMESIRYRLHKKLGLEKHQSIKRYLSDLAHA